MRSERKSAGQGLVLTRHIHWQVVQQDLAKLDVKFDGDPDIRPITSN